MIKTIQITDEVMNFAWKLCQDNLYASYPRINSMEDLKKEFEKAIKLENRSLIACYDQEVLCGVCAYFWIGDEKYAQTSVFLINEDYDKTAEEFIGYIGRQLPGFNLLIGVPSTNQEANEYFVKKNIEKLDSSIVTALYNLECHGNTSHEQVEKVTNSNFGEYAIFHDKYAIPLGMYYNSKNLLKDMEHFRVFAFRHDGVIHGGILIKLFKDGADVVGLFVDEEYKNEGIGSILLNETLMQLYNEFGSLREILYFIDEDSPDELKAALDAGFVIKEKYRCYKYVLR
jgi:GNAT superfamily N-acetyltransferase